MTRLSRQQILPLNIESMEASALSSPEGYRGLAAFHKYWGKKPLECLGFLIEVLTNENDFVLDPFLGSGLIARETAVRHRRFIGIDINPISIELAKLFIDLPIVRELKSAISSLEKTARPQIDQSYILQDGLIATHYLWNNSELTEIWIAGRRGKNRVEIKPAEHDLEKSKEYTSYRSRHIRDIRLCENSRVNTSASLVLGDLFTGRALRNIDILIDHISKYPEPIRRALLLILTASCGQMSQMVFAITGRGKTKGNTNHRVEVGSWVVGYWRPSLHFEINVWNCYFNRARRLLDACHELSNFHSFSASSKIEDVLSGSSLIALINDDASSELKKIPANTVKLILTDPPHSDRIPYLELSELWNAILGKTADFEREIVVSNARERNKNKRRYNKDMFEFLIEAFRVLAEGGFLALLFNARDGKSWEFLAEAEEKIPGFNYLGCFPLTYSARSVIQDNRSGALRHDYVLIYFKHMGKTKMNFTPLKLLRIPEWSIEFPKKRE